MLSVATTTATAADVCASTTDTEKPRTEAHRRHW